MPPRFPRRALHVDKRKKVPNWDHVPLGSDADGVFAKQLGVTVQAVAKARARRGINPYEPKGDRATSEAAVLKVVPWVGVMAFRRLKTRVKMDMTDRHLWRILARLIKAGLVKAKRGGPRTTQGYYRMKAVQP